MRALPLPGKLADPVVWILYSLFGAGPWLFLLGYTVWEVIVPECTSGRELWPPPSAAFLYMIVYGAPWLLLVTLVSGALIAGRQNVVRPIIATAGIAFLSWFVLLVTGPFAQSLAWEAMRAECQRLYPT